VDVDVNKERTLRSSVAAREEYYLRNGRVSPYSIRELLPIDPYNKPTQASVVYNAIRKPLPTFISSSINQNMRNL
jgi:hypothetical protein